MRSTFPSALSVASLVISANKLVPSWMEKGQHLHTTGIVQDITEQKQIAKVLKKGKRALETRVL